jgi:hypothetical protein
MEIANMAVDYSVRYLATINRQGISEEIGLQYARVIPALSGIFNDSGPHGHEF